MAAPTPTQLGPEDKISFSPFSYAKAIIKDNTTYPIVPNCPIINVDENGHDDHQNIPVGTFFITHFSYYNTPGDGGWLEELYLRIPDDTGDGDPTLYAPGVIKFGERWKDPSSSGGGDVNETSAQ